MLGQQHGGTISRLVKVVVVVAIVMGARQAYLHLAAEDAREDQRADMPEVGACYAVVSNPEDYTDNEISSADCGADDAQFRALAVLTDPADPGAECEALGAHGTFVSSAWFESRQVSTAVCGVLNVEEGDCLSIVGMGYEPTSCEGEAPLRERIVAMVDVDSPQEASDPALAARLCGRKSIGFLPFASEKQIACLAES